MFRLAAVTSILLVLIVSGIQVHSAPKNNDNIYKVNYANNPADEEAVNIPEIMKVCNSSFITPMSYLEEMKATGHFPDEIDKTSMCFLRCLWENSGLLKDGYLNANIIRKYIWPATGDSLEACATEGMNENECVRLYMTASCLMLRALADAPSKPTV